MILCQIISDCHCHLNVSAHTFYPYQSCIVSEANFHLNRNANLRLFMMTRWPHNKGLSDRVRHVDFCSSNLTYRYSNIVPHSSQTSSRLRMVSLSLVVQKLGEGDDAH